jgi:uncharacterized protein YqcC (DUF446 family)
VFDARSGGWPQLMSTLKKQMKEGRGTVSNLFQVDAGDDDDDGGANSMVLREFITAIIRVAWECYARSNTGVGTRLNALLERALLPGSSHLIDASDPMEAELSSRRVQAITTYFSDEILHVFNTFAAADVSLSGQDTLETMSFTELVFMVKQAELIDGNLTCAQLSSIFAFVNAQANDDGEKDDDDDELNFIEFKNCLCRIANAKIPKKDRGGEPFEHTWRAFLQIVFLPKMRKVIKDMKKGVMKKTL